jgi:hypothetical protein
MSNELKTRNNKTSQHSARAPGDGERSLEEKASEDAIAARISRDERNLATYPIALLSFQKQQGRIIRQVRDRRHPLTKKPIKSVWQAEGSVQLGLPTPTDDAVLLVLIEMSREMGFPQDVYFTRYEVLQRLGWPDNQDHYKKIYTALRRLQAVTITSENVFWDTASKSFVSTGFHVIDQFEIVNGRPGRRASGKSTSKKKADTAKETTLDLPFSHFKWSDVIWKSFRDGNLKPISLSFFFSLKLPLSRRLYRLLDSVRHDGKLRYEIGLRKLCEQYLALSPAQYASTYKHTLIPAHQELILSGFLIDAEVVSAKTEEYKVVYTFGVGKGQHAKPLEKLSAHAPTATLSSDDLAATILERLQHDDPDEYRRIRSAAYGHLGSLNIAALNRDPNNAAALRVLSDHMKEIIKDEYEERFTFITSDDPDEKATGEEAT